MENAVEALKIGFGVIVFAVALTVLFRMTSLIRGTSEEVFSSMDKSTYIDFTADTSKINKSGEEKSNGKRIVCFTDIIPTIYRYSQEGYGVTIIKDNQIIARFDLNTESQVASCIWKYEDFRYSNSKEEINKTKHSLTKYLRENIFDVVFDVEGNTIPASLKTQSADSYDAGSEYGRFSWLNNLVLQLYGTGTENDIVPVVYTSWISSNRYSNNYITQRINCDLYGGDDKGITYFGAKNPGVSDENEEKIGQHKTCYKNGLFNEFKNSQFVEYITEVDRNAYIIDANGELTDLLQYGTLRYAKQREIIYVYNGEK